VITSDSPPMTMRRAPNWLGTAVIAASPLAAGSGARLLQAPEFTNHAESKAYKC